jgi:hypothetical protein
MPHHNRRTIYGIGINDIEETYLKAPRFYSIWRHMLQRCYSSVQQSKRPSYVGCSVVEEWYKLSNFRIWYDENNVDGWNLDKDLLFPKNKIYSPDTCVFVPTNINSLFTFTTKNRGELPLGVFYHKRDQHYRSQCCDGTRKRITSSFDTPEKAHFWYLENKIKVIDKYLSEDYNDKIKQGLKNWKVLLQEHLDNKVEFIA